MFQTHHSSPQLTLLGKTGMFIGVGINFFHLPLLIPSTGGLAKVESLSYLKIISLMAFSKRVISEEAQKP